MRHFFKGTGASLLSGACLATACPGIVSAQVAPADPSSETADIIVTAQGREQSLQDVPISAAVVTGEAIQNANITSVQSLAQALPGVTIVSGGRTDRLLVRGTGSGGNPALEQSVSLFVDGVYHGRSRSSRASFLDLDRVEILKGPQSTYFGNNSIAGAISVISRKPTTDWSMDGRVLYGMDNEYALEVGAGGPVTDTLGIRLAGLISGFEGYATNTFDGSKVGGQRNRAVRATLEWKPSDAFDARLKVERGGDFRPNGLPIQMSNCPAAAPFAPPAATSNCGVALANGIETTRDNRVSISPGAFSNLESQEYVFDWNFRFGAGLTLTSITALSKFNYDLALDLDQTFLNRTSATTDERYEQFTQELRVASDADKPLSFVLGGYYLDYTNYNDTNFNFATIVAKPVVGPAPALPYGYTLNFDENGKTYSAYGSVTWKPIDSIRVTIGGRYTRSDKTLRQTAYYGRAPTTGFGLNTRLTPALEALQNVFGQAAPSQGYAGTVGPLSRSDSKFTPAVNAQFDVTDRVMIYASYAEGFKGGGFNGADTTGVAANLPFLPEEAKAYEIGIKSRFGPVTLNAALFQSDYSNRQVAVSIIANGTFVNLVRNAAQSRVKGAEIEARFSPSPVLSFGIQATYLDSKYRSYANAAATEDQLRINPLATQDLTGQRTEFAPEFSGRFDVALRLPVSDTHRVSIDGQLFRTSSYSIFPSNDPNLIQEAYWRIDGRVAIGRIDDKIELSVIGRNLTDRQILIFGNALGGSRGSYSVALDRGRSVAAQLSFKF